MDVAIKQCHSIKEFIERMKIVSLPAKEVPVSWVAVSLVSVLGRRWNNFIGHMIGKNEFLMGIFTMQNSSRTSLVSPTISTESFLMLLQIWGAWTWRKLTLVFVDDIAVTLSVRITLHCKLEQCVHVVDFDGRFRKIGLGGPIHWVQVFFHRTNVVLQKCLLSLVRLDDEVRIYGVKNLTKLQPRIVVDKRNVFWFCWQCYPLFSSKISGSLLHETIIAIAAGRNLSDKYNKWQRHCDWPCHFPTGMLVENFGHANWHGNWTCHIRMVGIYTIRRSPK